MFSKEALMDSGGGSLPQMPGGSNDKFFLPGRGWILLDQRLNDPQAAFQLGHRPGGTGSQPNGGKLGGVSHSKTI